MTGHTGRLLHRDHIAAVCMRPEFVVAVLDWDDASSALLTPARAWPHPAAMAGNSPVYSHGCKSPLPVAECVAGKPGDRTLGRILYFSYSSRGCRWMTVYGYAKVSVRETEDKNLDLQVSRLVRAGCAMGNIRAEEASGAKNDRGGLLELLDLVVEGGHPGGHPHRPALQGADLWSPGDRGSTPGGSGAPVPVGRLRHFDVHRQAPARDGARLQRVVAELDQGALGRGPGKGTDRVPFPWPATEPERVAAGVHPGGAVEGSEPAGTGQAPGTQPLDHPTGGRVGVGWKLQPPLESRA